MRLAVLILGLLAVLPVASRPAWTQQPPPVDAAASPPADAAPVPTPSVQTRPVHGMAMHGEAKHATDFRHFDYVNPNAPKGGSLRLAAVGTFDSFNPYIDRGTPGAAADAETLMTDAADEPFSIYGEVAETIETPPDRSWVIFRLNKVARWHDGKPITAEDVLWSLDTLRTKGTPFYRFYYRDIAKAEALDTHTVKFTFAPGSNRELALIAGQLPVLPKHWWAGRDFAQPTLEPPLSSGPYKVARFEPGRFIEFERVKDYWGEKIPVRIGQNNFDRIRYDYYQDDTIVRQAIKGGLIDYYMEMQAKAWALDYDVPAVRDGRLIKRGFPEERPAGMQGFVMNLRRAPFDDIRLRRAIGLAFDFEWSNKTLFFGQYTRTQSYFSNSDLASRGLPSPEELEILEPLRGKIPDEVFTREWKASVTDGSGWPRDNLEKAFALLAEAGYEVRDMRLVNKETGRPVRFEFMLAAPAAPSFARIVLPFARNLKRLGIEVMIRSVDTPQYINRIRAFDFDMILSSWGQSESPGNEQRDFWGSAAAARNGSRNTMGIKDPAIDALIESVIAAPDRAGLVTRTRALDRVLLWNDFLVTNWHLSVDRLIYWDKFGIPEPPPSRGTDIMTWWVDPAKAAKLAAAGGPGN